MAIVFPSTLPPIPDTAVLSDIMVTEYPIYYGGELTQYNTAYITGHIISPDPLLTYSYDASQVRPVQIEYCLVDTDGSCVPGIVEQNGYGAASITPDGIFSMNFNGYTGSANIAVGLCIVENDKKTLYRIANFSIGDTREVTAFLNEPENE